MRSLFFPLGLALLLMACQKSEKQRNDVSRYGHNGPIKRMIIHYYQSEDFPQDTTQFNSRVLYDYDRDGHVTFIQSVINRTMMNAVSDVSDYRYEFKDGLKTGWKETKPNGGDSTYGVITWENDSTLVEKSFDSKNQLQYQIVTVLNERNEEKTTDFTYYINNGVFQHTRFTGIFNEENQRIGLIELNVLDNSTDTSWLKVEARDGHGNPTRTRMTYSSGRPGRCDIRAYEYY